MLTGGLEPMYREALAASHTSYTLVEVLDGNQNTLEILPQYQGDAPARGLVFINGSVDATLTSRISRNLSMTVPEGLYPYQPGELLAPYGNMIRCWRGIQYGDNTHAAWVTFVGRIQQALLNEDGTCSIQAADFAADVLENKFIRPENSQPTNTVSEEVVRLITDGFPQADFGLVEQFPDPVRSRTWQLDRGQALDEMGTAVGAYWYPLADGRFTLRRYPWTVFSEPVVTYADHGDLGVVEGSRAVRSRSDVYNSLTVTGERLNGDPAVYATAADNNPASPTYVGGNFGRRHQLLRLQTPGTDGAAQGAANENLQRLISLNDVWGWTMPTDAALELGDTVGLEVHDQVGIVQVVASMRIPLGLGSMQVTGRSRVAGILEGVE